MKKISTLIIFLSISASIIAQQNFNDSIANARNKLTKNAMIVLGSWSVANIATGFIIAGQTNGEAKYAWRMNGYWNLFNLGIAGLGYAGLRRAILKKNNFTDNMKAQQAIEKLYVFNAGLDLVYIAGGLYLRERGKNQTKLEKQYQFKGYGTSILIQGGFLLLMDGVMFSLHHKNTIRMNNKLEQLEIKAGPAGLGLSYNF